MTPAERLLAAADLLDARQVSMRPDLDKALAAWLRAEANRVLNGPVVFGGEKALFTVSPEALAFADLLLAGGS